MAANEKRAALDRQHSTTSTESEKLGFSVPIFSFSSSEICDAINVGEGLRVHDQRPRHVDQSSGRHPAEYTAVDVDSLKKAFTDFLETLGIALATEPREVDDDDPRALWPATEPTDSFGPHWEADHDQGHDEPDQS